MNVILYALVTYAVTAVISLAVVAIIVGINRLCADKPDNKGDAE